MYFKTLYYKIHLLRLGCNECLIFGKTFYNLVSYSDIAISSGATGEARANGPAKTTII